jgi:hypothetical protein
MREKRMSEKCENWDQVQMGKKKPNSHHTNFRNTICINALLRIALPSLVLKNPSKTPLDVRSRICSPTRGELSSHDHPVENEDGRRPSRTSGKQTAKSRAGSSFGGSSAFLDEAALP